ncbi:MAG: hypothetical protein WCG98_01695 [bacterium]
MYVGIPKRFKAYFTNAFFASYPTSDIIDVTPIKIPENREHIRFSRRGKFLTKEEFTRDGTYMDPMSALFALFTTIDQESRLDLYFTYSFKHPRTLAYVFKLLWGTRKGKSDLDAEPKKEEKPEIFASFSFKIFSKDPYLTQQLKQNIRSAYAPFISNGKVRIWKAKKYYGLTHAQADNFFHIPMKENFVKGLDYCVYKKLPYPVNLPTLKNTQANDLTIIGNTDYRGEKITFGIKKEDKFRHVYIV